VHPQIQRQIKQVADLAQREIKKQTRNIPVPFRREAEKQVRKAVAPIKREVDALTKDIPKGLKGPAQALANSVLAGKFDADAAKKLGAKEAKKVLNQYATKYGTQALSKVAPELKIPGGINPAAAADLLLSGKRITAEAALQAGYGTVKGVGDKYLSSVTGIPISLPQKLTAKEIGKSLTSLIPTDVQGVIDTGLALGTQVAASALTSVLAGAGVGSVIPGLGTVVGIGVALGVQALKGPVTKLLKGPPPPYQRKCPTNVKCPEVPNKSAIEIIPWAARNMAQVANVLAQDQKKSYCGRGSAHDCVVRLDVLMGRAYDIVSGYDTVPMTSFMQMGQHAQRTWKNGTTVVVGLYQVEKYIKLYEGAPKSHAWYDSKARKIIQVKNEPVIEVLAHLRERKRVLDAFVKKSKTIATMAPAEFIGGTISGFRGEVYAELRNAMMQYSFDPSPETTRWVEDLGKMMSEMDKRVKAYEKGRRGRVMEVQARREALSKDPNWKPIQHRVD
jgi:hypothetical protein